MSEPTPPPPSDEEARRQRAEALSKLALSSSGTTKAAPPGSASGDQARTHLPRTSLVSPRTARRRPPWLVILSAILVIVVVAGVVLYQRGVVSRVATKILRGSATSVVIVPSLQDLDCLHDAAWSPNGQQIAVIGYRDQCPDDDGVLYAYQESVVHLYGAASGKLVRTILPDATVLALPGIPLPPATVQPESADSDTGKPVINYTHLLWSPDGKQLALTFYVSRLKATGTFVGIPTFAQLPPVGGLALMNADGTHERATLFPEPSNRYGFGFPVETSSRYTPLEWNTSTLQALLLPYGESSFLQPAESYSWAADGVLLPDGSLTSGPASPATPIGNPAGGSSFSTWQPGNILYLTQIRDARGSTVLLNPGVYLWYSDFPTWSPDGRYLIDSLLLPLRAQPTGEPTATTKELQAAGLGFPSIAIRDQGLQQLLKELPNQVSQLPQDTVAWSPNGRIVAALPEGTSASSAGSSPSAPVSFYDTGTGKNLGALQPQQSSQVSGDELSQGHYLGSTSFLRWSTNSTHVLVFSAQLDTITIWGPSMLPESDVQ